MAGEEAFSGKSRTKVLGKSTEVQPRVEKYQFGVLEIKHQLFTTAKAWKQPKRPSADERVRKMWCIHVTERYSAIGRG